MRRLEEHGHLRPTVHLGVNYFDREAVLRFARLRRLEAENVALRNRVNDLEGSLDRGRTEEGSERAELLNKLRRQRDEIESTLASRSIWERRRFRREGLFDLFEDIDRRLALIDAPERESQQ